MELEIQHQPGPVRVTVQGPGDSEELQQIVTLLQSTADRLWLVDERQEADSISIRDLLTMWLVALVFAMVESAIFPEQAACTRTRTLLWLGAANLCFVGGALLFGWFAGVPLWGGLLLAAFLELGLMWFGDHFVLKMDSAQLTRELKQYQNRLQQEHR